VTASPLVMLKGWRDSDGDDNIVLKVHGERNYYPYTSKRKFRMENKRMVVMILSHVVFFISNRTLFLLFHPKG
jgi:hypothetical protein